MVKRYWKSALFTLLLAVAYTVVPGRLLAAGLLFAFTVGLPVGVLVIAILSR